MESLSKRLEEMLIEDYADQAYHKGIALVSKCVKIKEMDFAKHVALACQNLMQKGFHKFERKGD